MDLLTFRKSWKVSFIWEAGSAGYILTPVQVVIDYFKSEMTKGSRYKACNESLAYLHYNE